MWNDTVTKLPRRLSDGPVDDVEATRQRVDAIFPKLKFRKRKKRTPSQHEIPVPNSTSFWRRVLHAAREVVHALEDDDVPTYCGIREGRPAAAASSYSG